MPGLWHDARGPLDGPLVALVHGSMDRSASFVPVVRRLPGLRTVRYDRRGYGRSRDAGPPPGLDGHVEDLLGLLAHVDHRPAVLVGHSYGGTIALTAAARRPGVAAAVVAFEAPTPWEPWYPPGTGGAAAAAAGPGGEGDAAEAFLRRLLGDERWEALPERTRRQRRAEGPALVADMRSSRRRPRPFRPEQLTTPVVAAHGTRSAAHLRRAARRLADEAPAGELVVVEGADHGAHFGDPDGFAALVARAVARAAATPRS